MGLCLPAFNGLARGIRDGKLLYLNKNKASLMVEAYRRYLPTVSQLERALSDFIISDGYAKVKTEKDLVCVKMFSVKFLRIQG